MNMNGYKLIPSAMENGCVAVRDAHGYLAVWGDANGVSRWTTLYQPLIFFTWNSAQMLIDREKNLGITKMQIMSVRAWNHNVKTFNSKNYITGKDGRVTAEYSGSKKE